MVEVGRDDGAPARDFAAHEFGRDFLGQAGPEMLPWVLAQEHLGHALAGGAGGAQALHVVLAVEVFADGDELHLGRDDAAARVVHLRHVGTGAGAARLALQARKAQRLQLGVGGAFAPKGAAQATQHLAVGALLDPALAQRGQAAADVDHRRRVAVGAGAVVNKDGRIRLGPHAGRGVGLADLAHRHLHIRARAGYVDFARVGQWRNGGLVHLGGAGQKGFGGGVHGKGVLSKVVLARYYRRLCSVAAS